MAIIATKRIGSNIAAALGLTPVLFNDWVKIDNEEKTRGQLKGKPREKIVSIPEMLHIIKSK